MTAEQRAILAQMVQEAQELGLYAQDGFVLDTRPWWGIFDARTDRQVGMFRCRTKERAEDQMKAWQDRDVRGGRPDIHDDIPFMEARQI